MNILFKGLEHLTVDEANERVVTNLCVLIGTLITLALVQCYPEHWIACLAIGISLISISFSIRALKIKLD